jgi:hypothetical protein
MVALVAIGGPVVLALLYWWMSAATDRRTARSMERYGSALGVLGDVSRRTEAAAPIHTPSPDEIAQPHVEFDPELSSATRAEEAALARTEERIAEPLTLAEPIGDLGPPLKIERMPLFDDLPSVPNARETAGSVVDPNATAAALGRMVARSRFNREYGVTADDRRTTDIGARVHLSAPTVPLLFGADDVDAFDDVTTAVPAVDLARIDGRHGPRQRELRVGPPSGSKRRHELAAALVVGALVIAGALVVSLGHSPKHVATRPGVTTSSAPGSGGATKAKSTTTTTTTPTALDPTSTTNLLVTYLVPKATYTLVFSATAPCWLGAQGRTNGTYLWMDTLQAGTSTSYSATGPRLIHLGAPRAVSIKFNGIPVALPSANIQSYVIKLVVPKST